MPEGDKGVVKKRPNPWAHEATGDTGNAKSSYREGQKVKVQRLSGLDADAQAAGGVCVRRRGSTTSSTCARG